MGWELFRWVEIEGLKLIVWVKNMTSCHQNLNQGNDFDHSKYFKTTEDLYRRRLNSYRLGQNTSMEIKFILMISKPYKEKYFIFWKLLWYYRLFDFSSSKPRNSRTEFPLLLGTSRLFDEISGCIKVFPTFKEFIQYVIEKPTNHDPHWMTYNKVLVIHST